MATESVDIVVRDKVSSSIATKLNNIAKQALSAQKAITGLNSALSSINSSSFSRLATAIKSVDTATKTLSITTKTLTTAFVALDVELDKKIVAFTKLTSAMQLATQGQKAYSRVATSGKTQEAAITSSITQHAAALTRLVTNLNRATQAQRRLSIAQKEGAISGGSSAVAQGGGGLSNLAGAAVVGGAVAGPISNSALALQNLNNSLQSNEKIRVEARNTLGQYTKASVAAKEATRQLNTHMNHSTGIIRKGAGAWSSLLLWLAAYQVAIRTIQSFDTDIRMRSTIKAIVGTTRGQASAISDELYTVAERSRASVEEVSKAFIRFDLSLRNYGVSVKESIRFTETVTKALIAAGTAPQEASSALLQLSQAMNKGKLDGDEFRTMMETVPTIMDKVAITMGLVGKHGEILRGKLLDLAPQGKITANVIRKAVLSMGDEVDKIFKEMPLTIGQALTLVSNRFTQWIGDIQEGTGAVSALAHAIERLTRDFTALIATLLTAITTYKAFSIGAGINAAAMVRQQKVVAAEELVASRVGDVSSAKRAVRTDKRKAIGAAKEVSTAKTFSKGVEAASSAEIAAVQTASAAKLRVAQKKSDLVRGQGEVAITNLRKERDLLRQEAHDIERETSKVYSATPLTGRKSALIKDIKFSKDALVKAKAEEEALFEKYSKLQQSTAYRSFMKKDIDYTTRAANLERRLIDERAYQKSIKDSPALHGRYAKSIQAENKLQKELNSVLTAQDTLRTKNAKSIKSVTAARDAYTASTVKRVASEVNLQSAEKNLANINSKLTSAEKARREGMAKAQILRDKAAAKNMASDEAYLKHKTKADDIITKQVKANATAEKRILEQTAAAQIAANAKVNRSINAKTVATAKLKDTLKEAAVAQKALTTAETQAAVARRGFWSTFFMGIGKGLAAIGRFIFSWGGLVAAILASVAALVLFSGKIRLFKDDRTATLWDAFVVGWNSMIETLRTVDNPFRPMVEFMSDFGNNLRLFVYEVADLMDYYNNMFEGNRTATVAATSTDLFIQLAKDRLIYFKKLKTSINKEIAELFMTLSRKFIGYVYWLNYEVFTVVYNVLKDMDTKLGASTYILSWLDRIKDSIIKFLSLLETLPIKLVNSIINAGIKLYNALYKIGEEVSNRFKIVINDALSGKWVRALSEQFKSLIHKSFTFTPTAQSNMVAAFNDFIEYLKNLPDKLYKVGKEISKATGEILRGITSGGWFKDLIDIKFSDMSWNSNEFKLTTYEEIVDLFKDLPNKVITFIEDATSTIYKALREIIKSFSLELKKVIDNTLSGKWLTNLVDKLFSRNKVEAGIKSIINSLHFKNTSRVAKPIVSESVKAISEEATLKNLFPDLDVNLIKEFTKEQRNKLFEAWNNALLNKTTNQDTILRFLGLDAPPATYRESIDRFMRKVNLRSIVAKGSKDWAVKLKDRVTGEEVDQKYVDFLDKFNRKLEDRIKLFGVFGEARKVQQEMDKLEENALSKKIVLSEKELTTLRAKITNVVHLEAVQSKLNSIYEQTTGVLYEYTLTIEAANKALTSGMLTTQQYSKIVDEARIKVLETNNSIANGIEHGILTKLQGIDGLTKQISSVVTTSFDSMSSTIVDFVAAGKFSLGNFKDGLAQWGLEVVKIVSKVVTELLIIKPIVESLKGALTGGGSNLSGGLLGGLVSGVGSLLGFASGGAFTVGGSAGRDTNLVSFKATKGERVIVQTPDQQKQQDRQLGNNVVVNMTINTPNPAAFRASESQVASQMNRMIQKAQRRA